MFFLIGFDPHSFLMATVTTFDLTVNLCMKESLCTFLTGDNGVNLACIHPALWHVSCHWFMLLLLL